ncbi:hypothetical protein Peur_000116 [Populus x canadensis]
MAASILFLEFLALSFSLALALDPSSLQDFCVADGDSNVVVNGLACKYPKNVQASHFSFSGLHLAGNTSNGVGSKVTAVNVVQIPGLNTLGISVARIDYAPSGINPPHTHPRASEILTVLEGSLEVGFVTSNPGNRLITKVLQKGDVFVFPINLVHFQRNVGKSNAVALAALSSQNAGVITIANAVFGTNPEIPDDILAKAFQLDKNQLYSLTVECEEGQAIAIIKYLNTMKEDSGYDSSTDDENDEEEESPRRNVIHGYHMVRGKLGHGMEDYVVAENRKINGHENGEATQISVDHDPQKEKEHVESKGGFVYEAPDAHNSPFF